jgi:hypothetical protein
VLGFNRQCHEYMIIDWNEGSINKGSSVKYVSRWIGGQYPMLDKFWFYLRYVGLHSGGSVLAKM